MIKQLFDSVSAWYEELYRSPRVLSAEVLRSFIKDFTIPRRDGNENVKINNRFRRQNNNFAAASHFFSVFARLRREIA